MPAFGSASHRGQGEARGARAARRRGGARGREARGPGGARAWGAPRPGGGAPGAAARTGRMVRLRAKASRPGLQRNATRVPRLHTSPAHELHSRSVGSSRPPASVRNSVAARPRAHRPRRRRGGTRAGGPPRAGAATKAGGRGPEKRFFGPPRAGAVTKAGGRGQEDREMQLGSIPSIYDPSLFLYDICFS